MGFMFYVPACLVGHIRRGLFAELGLAGKEIEGLERTVAGEDTLEELRLLVACVDGVRALLHVLFGDATDGAGDAGEVPVLTVSCTA